MRLDKIKTKLSKILRCKSGGFAVESSLAIIVFVMFLAFFLSFFPVVTRISVQNSMANELARYTEIRGAVDSSVTAEFERLKQTSTITDAELYWDVDFIEGTNKIALQEPFTITIHSKAKIGVGTVFAIPVTVKSKASGRSENYWK